jgi:hypothetical protein
LAHNDLADEQGFKIALMELCEAFVVKRIEGFSVVFIALFSLFRIAFKVFEYRILIA